MQGPTGPPGVPGSDAICPKCPLAEELEMREPTQCPRVEKMRECPAVQSKFDVGVEEIFGRPMVVDRLLPLVVEFVSFFFYFCRIALFPNRCLKMRQKLMLAFEFALRQI